MVESDSAEAVGAVRSEEVYVLQPVRHSLVLDRSWVRICPSRGIGFVRVKAPSEMRNLSCTYRETQALQGVLSHSVSRPVDHLLKRWEPIK